MFRQILFTQWRWSAQLMALLGALVIALPIAAFNDLPAAPGAIITRSTTWGFLYPGLAALTGLLLGLTAWTADHRGQHVYALTLPVPRWFYALLRYAAGIALVMAVVGAALAGTLIATAGLTLPPGMHTYAGLVTIRFALGAVLVYSIVFAISSATTRTAGGILGVLGGLLLAEFLTNRFGSDISILEPIAKFLVSPAGPFGIFSMPWLLVAV
jgi:hypothetical protein